MFYRWFANVTAAKTREGLVLIDTGAYFNQDATLEADSALLAGAGEHRDLHAWARRSRVRNAGDC